MPDVAGVRVLITGGTSGLGLAMARGLVNGGARVLITGRDAERVRGAVSTLSGCPGSIDGIVMDVRDEASVRRGVEEAVQRLSGLDVLVNNAGLGMRHVNPRFLSEPQPFWEVAADGFRDVVDTNLTGYFLVARAVAPRFVEQGHGKIINISMNHETMRRRGFVPYGPSRAGAESLSAIMAADLADHGVTVNMLLPGGATVTGMIPDDVPAAVRDALLDPAIMEDPVRWLCSADSDGVTGERVVATEFDAWLKDHFRP
ncbi:SDR family NAD(P)-dependent oxidoreductase [Actinoallomurus rhizosphaericola]|uniref:SDR family NAD(P)-dependent oxidoreductase n=1 Tax=Actinoallomurus rhizosphaericola TaxID=2952536 RepID=UPI0020919152|nr:SDR family oxidoreductase [Actinoallomurus rhizosphaericola]MCO5992025.1 SDR family oxidoreductase [Actinoallomurus rhizosphaericola]